MDVKYMLHGMSSSSFLMDEKSGWVIEGKSIDKLQGHTEIKDGPRAPGGMTIPMEVHSVMTLRGK